MAVPGYHRFVACEFASVCSEFAATTAKLTNLNYHCQAVPNCSNVISWQSDASSQLHLESCRPTAAATFIRNL